MSYVQNASLSHALYRKLTKALHSYGFKLNPNNLCVVNKMVNGKFAGMWMIRGLFLSKHGHPDIVPPIAYLTTWVQKPNHADWTMLC